MEIIGKLLANKKDPVYKAKVLYRPGLVSVQTDVDGSFTLRLELARRPARPLKTHLIALLSDYWPRKIPVTIDRGFINLGDLDFTPIGQFLREKLLGKVLSFFGPIFLSWWVVRSRMEKILCAFAAFACFLLLLPLLLIVALELGVNLPTDYDENARELLQRMGVSWNRPMVEFHRVRRTYYANVNYRLPRGSYDVEISGDITIEPSSKLTLEPGTVLRCGPNTHIVVRGALVANGTQEEWIIFQPLESKGRWGNLTFWDSESISSSLGHCRIQSGSGVNCRGSASGYFKRDATGWPCGGGLLLYNSVVSLNHVEIEDCSASYGGGLYIRNAPAAGGAELPGSRFQSLHVQGCSAQGQPDSSGGAVWVQRSHPEFRGSVFRSNRSLGSNACGGAVFLGLDSQALFDEGCRFEENRASAEGGALYASNLRESKGYDKSGLVIRNSEFADNRSRGTGGAISATDARVKLDGSKIERNTVESASFTGLQSSALGGGVYLQFSEKYKFQTPTQIIGCRFIGNQVHPIQTGRAFSGGGLAILINGKDPVPVQMRENIFSRNSAGSGDHLVTSMTELLGWDGTWDRLTQFSEPDPTPNTVSIYERLSGAGVAIDSARKLSEHLSDNRPKGAPINSVIIHALSAVHPDPYNLEACLEVFRGGRPKRSSHFLIDRGGKIYLLVPEEKRAWHAERTRLPSGEESVDDFSLGIELMGKEQELLTTLQYSSLVALLKDLRKRYPRITPDRIVGHDQIRSLWNLENSNAAPAATDPGPLFHWSHVLSEMQR